MKASPFRNRLLLIAFLIVLVVFGALVLRMVRLAPTPAETETRTVEEEPPRREVILYFAGVPGDHLAPETREIDDCLEETDCIRSTVQALLDGPAGDLVPILPPRAALRDVAVDGGTAVIDFSSDLVSAHPGGSASELLTAYGLANTLAENFPHIRQVQFLVAGETVESLKGHVDLRGPVQADFGFSRLPDEAVKE